MFCPSVSKPKAYQEELFCFDGLFHLPARSVCSLIFLRDSSVLNRQNACAFFEQLSKTAGGGVADHLGDLPHGEIGVDEQVFRLTHSSALNVLRDAAPELPLEAVL